MVAVWLRVRISAGRALKERQCTLKGQARYVNVWSSVHWKGVYKVRDKDLGDQVHKFPHVGKFMHLIPISFSKNNILFWSEIWLGQKHELFITVFVISHGMKPVWPAEPIFFNLTLLMGRSVSDAGRAG